VNKQIAILAYFSSSFVGKLRLKLIHKIDPRPRGPSTGHDSDPEPEDYVPPPPKANIGDLLAHALERSALKEESSTAAKPSKKGKRMKGQKISLTGGRLA
jgi:hypothetical protein